MFVTAKTLLVTSLAFKFLVATLAGLWFWRESEEIENLISKIKVNSLSQDGLLAYQSAERQLILFNNIEFYAFILAAIFAFLAIIVASSGRALE